MGAPNSAGAFRHYYSINNNNDDGVLKQNVFFVLCNVNQTVAGLIFNTTSQFIYDRLYKKWLSLIFSNSHCMKNGNCLIVIYNLMIGLPRNNKNTPFKVSKQLVQHRLNTPAASTPSCPCLVSSNTICTGQNR